jgi:hypothetical protein
MSIDLEQRIDGYLEGTLSAEETTRFEQDLLKPEVAEAFSQALMLQELLAKAPPEHMPAALLERIEASLESAEHTSDEKPGRLPRTRAVIQGLGWTLRGPALALAGLSRGGQGTRGAISGLGTVRYTLGPLNRSSRQEKPEPKPKSPLWKRVLRRGK